MDKKEYQEKLNEINRLIAIEDYSSAAAVADSIEWKRVRNVQTLLMVSEIYEAVNRYQDSKILLLRAYRRSPLGRTVLYRLVECCIALRQFDEAIEYYSEYVQASPRDNNKYILKYKIYRGRGSSLDEQINILKEYLDQEKDSERWSYELAKLYKEAGRTQECINTCDDLVLWYQSGKYVIKALELKKKIAPLTPKQQEIYDNRFAAEDEDDGEASEDAEASYLRQARAERASLQQDQIKSEIAQDVSRAAREKEMAEALSQTSASVASGTSQPEGSSGKPAAKAAAQTAEIPQTLAEEEPVQTVFAADKAEKEETAPETFAEGKAEETEAVDDGVHYNEEELKKNLAESMKSIIGGVGPRDEVDEEQAQLDRVIEQSKEDQEAAVASRGLGMTMEMQKKTGEQKPEAARLTIDDILLSMGDKGESVRKAVATKETAAESVPENVTPAEGQEEVMPERAPADVRPKEVPAETKPEEAPAEAKAEAAPAEARPEEAPAEAKAEAAPAEVRPEEAPAETPAEEKAEEKTAGEPAAGKEEAVRDILDAKTRVIPTEEVAKLHEQFVEREKLARSAGEKMAEKIAAQAEKEARAAEETAGREPAADEMTEKPAVEKPAAEKPAAEKPEEGTASATAAGVAPAKQQVPEEAGGEQVMKEVHAEQSVEEPQVFQDPQKTFLKPYQRNLFRGFLEIGDLEEQIASAIDQAESKGTDRTSRTGNVLILGGHGCGKTTIATGIAKAVAEDMGTHSVKMARIYAADLNRKDIAATIAKIAGGVLIIEEAGDLEDSIVDQLTTAMEFRTDGMIMILEDEQRYIHDLLMRHPRFTMKFTAQIYIPAFSSEDLVRFGELYAEDNDCVFSEEARQALTGRLEAVAKSGEVVSITNVIELTSRAIKNSGKFFRRIQSSKKRYDAQNRVILKAKDLR